MPSQSNKIKHKAKHKVNEAKLITKRKKLCRLTEIEEPITWIMDLKRCRRKMKCTKSILKPVEKQLDITLTLDALENEIVSKRLERPSTASSASTSSSGRRKPGRLSFQNVSVFYFQRALGQSSIPSDGSHPLGMGMKHVDQEKMKVSLYNSHQVRSSRVTRQKTEATKHNATTNKHRRILEETSTFLSQVSSSSSLSSVPSSSTSTAAAEVGRLSPDNNNRRERDGLFQQLCSSPGPRRMFSSSAISKLRSSPAFQRDLPPGYLGTRSDFPWQPVREAEAFSSQLSVEDIIETLPQPEHQMLSDISSNCTQSFSEYHQSLHPRTATEEDSEYHQSLHPRTATEEEHQVGLKSSVSCRLPLRRSSRKLEEVGGGLRLLSAKARQLLLRSKGVLPRHRTEGCEISDIQASREASTGCRCTDGCNSGNCECTRNNIPCHLEYRGFPCSCLATCNNPSGRRVFDNVAVAVHYINTMVSVGGVMDITDRSQPAKKRRR